MKDTHLLHALVVVIRHRDVRVVKLLEFLEGLALVLVFKTDVLTLHAGIKIIALGSRFLT